MIDEAHRRTVNPRTNEGDKKLCNDMHAEYVEQIKILWDRFKEASWNEPGLNRKTSITVR